MRSWRVHSLATETFLCSKVLGDRTLVPQFRLPRSFRNVSQASQVDLVQVKGPLQSLFLEVVTFLSGRARLSRAHTHLDVCLHAPPNLLREFRTHDWLPSGAVSIYLTSVSAERMSVVVKGSYVEFVRVMPRELETVSAK